MHKKIMTFFLLSLLFFSSSLFAATFPIEKKAAHSVSQMGVDAHVIVYANDKVDIELGYSNGNRSIDKMYAAVFITFVDIHGNKIYAYERRQTVDAVTCFWGICGKTVGKSEATSVSLPSGMASKVHDIKFTFLTNYQQIDFLRSAEPLKGILHLLSF